MLQFSVLLEKQSDRTQIDRQTDRVYNLRIFNVFSVQRVCLAVCLSVGLSPCLSGRPLCVCVCVLFVVFTDFLTDAQGR